MVPEWIRQEQTVPRTGSILAFGWWIAGLTFLLALGLGASYLLLGANQRETDWMDWACLFASAGSGGLAVHCGSRWGFSRAQLGLLAALVVVWGFSLWAYSHLNWIFVFFICACDLSKQPSSRRGKWLLFGGVIAAGLVLFLVGEELRVSDTTVALSWSKLAGAPLSLLGLWLLSLYFSRASVRLRRWALLAVLAYTMAMVMKEGRDFWLGSLLITSMLAWIGAPLLALFSKEKAGFWHAWSGGLVIALLVGFHASYAHLIYLFPFTALFLLWSLRQIRQRYPWLPSGWLFFPAWVLLVGGLLQQARAVFYSVYGGPT